MIPLLSADSFVMDDSPRTLEEAALEAGLTQSTVKYYSTRYKIGNEDGTYSVEDIDKLIAVLKKRMKRSGKGMKVNDQWGFRGR